jgi:hypothetical protein
MSDYKFKLTNPAAKIKLNSNPPNDSTAVQNKTDEEEKIQNSFILDRF